MIPRDNQERFRARRENFKREVYADFQQAPISNKSLSLHMRLASRNNVFIKYLGSTLNLLYEGRVWFWWKLFVSHNVKMSLYWVKWLFNKFLFSLFIIAFNSKLHTG